MKIANWYVGADRIAGSLCRNHRRSRCGIYYAARDAAVDTKAAARLRFGGNDSGELLVAPAARDRKGRSKLTPACIFFVATAGFLFGAIFMWVSDKTVSFARRKANNTQGKPNERLNRIIMLVLSITLHNIPEGLAVGVAFGALKNADFTLESLMGAVTIAVGIGLQNFPEGAAVSVPLRREGCSRKKSFFIGQASGMVEPIAGVIGALLVVYVEAILPYALSFAAGAMILVAVHELIPECQQNQKAQPYFATMGIVSGFAVMMLLDVMLG